MVNYREGGGIKTKRPPFYLLVIEVAVLEVGGEL